MKTLKQLLEKTFSKGLYTTEFIQTNTPIIIKEWLTQKKITNKKTLETLVYPEIMGGKIYWKGRVEEIEELLDSLEETQK
jgi:hypothetical protein